MSKIQQLCPANLLTSIPGVRTTQGEDALLTSSTELHSADLHVLESQWTGSDAPYSTGFKTPDDCSISVDQRACRLAGAMFAVETDICCQRASEYTRSSDRLSPDMLSSAIFELALLRLAFVLLDTPFGVLGVFRRLVVGLDFEVLFLFLVFRLSAHCTLRFYGTVP